MHARIVFVALPLLAAALTVAVPPAHPCRAPLPRGPVVPAPIILRTTCGGFRLAPEGRVTRLPRHWFARHDGTTGRRHGADIALRRTRIGRFILLRHGRVVWRSRSIYRHDGASSAFGPHLFAFAAYRRGIFLTDLEGPERLVMRGRGLYPLDFTRRGELLVVASSSRVVVLARDGAVLRRYRIRQRNGLTFDHETETMYFVLQDGTLAAAQGAHLTLLRKPRGVDGAISFTEPGRLIFTGPRSVTVTRLDGSLVAHARWLRSRVDVLDAGVSASPDGHWFAFRLSSARPGVRRGSAVVYVLHRGALRARAVYRHRLGQSGCAVGAGLGWNGRFLLYGSTDGHRSVLDARSGRRIDLGPLARALPRRVRIERAYAYWANDFR